VSIHPDRAYQLTRAELADYEYAAFDALRAGVPDCYRDSGPDTHWGAILSDLSQHMARLDHADHYAMFGTDPNQLNPADILRVVAPFLPIGHDYPDLLASDLEFKDMVLNLVRAYRYGARLPALGKVIEAFIGTSQAYTVTEMYTQIGKAAGIDVSYRNTIQVYVPLGGSGASITNTPNMLQNISAALAKAKCAHIGISLIGKFPVAEDFSGYLRGIKDDYKFIMKLRDGNMQADTLYLAPYAPPTHTVLAPDHGLILAYQWYRNGIAIPGEDGPTLTLPTTAADEGTATYCVHVIDPLLGEVWSKQIPLQVIPEGTPMPWPPAPTPEPHPPTNGLIVVRHPMARVVTTGTEVVLDVEVANVATIGTLYPFAPRPWTIATDRAISDPAPTFVDDGFVDPGFFETTGRILDDVADN